jgi:phage regulator Rha-like protein
MEVPDIQHKIYEIREQKVMLDFDLAILYEVETRVLNQSVKRNMDNFPDEFMFQLSLKEWEEILSSKSILYLDNGKSNSSQFVMSSRKHRGKSYTPYAFTEHGVGMLACVLKSPKARKMNIAIVKTFIALRKSVSQFSNLREQLSELRERIGEHDVQLAQIYDSIENLLDEKSEQKKWENRPLIGFVK